MAPKGISTWAKRKGRPSCARSTIGWQGYPPFRSDNDENMAQELSSSAQKVQDVLHILGYASRVVELPNSTRTAREAAQAIGCQPQHSPSSAGERLLKGERMGIRAWDAEEP